MLSYCLWRNSIVCSLFYAIFFFHMEEVQGWQQIFNKKLIPQPTWRLKNRYDDVKVIDVLSVLSRFEKREDFYEGRGYSRPEKGLLTNEMFYDSIKGNKVKRIPKSNDGTYFGLTENQMRKELEQLPPSQQAADAVFTSFAKGATNGVAYPKQVDEEMSFWLTNDSRFDLSKFQLSLLLGRFYVLLGWFLYIGLQFGGVYVVFFVPIMSQFFPDVDFYPIQTYLHTSEWGK